MTESGNSGDYELPEVLEDRESYVLRIHEKLPSTRPAIGDAVRRVMQIVDEVGGLSDGKTDLEIALREALANAVIHGNKQDDNKRVTLRVFAAAEGGVLVSIRDQGQGFDPGEVPDPRGADRLFLHHGRGIFLMHELMDHVEHRDNGREVLLFKACQPDSGDEAAPKDGDASGEGADQA